MTENEFEAIEIKSVRCEVSVFSVHETVSASDPLPLVFETVSHDPLPEALQLPPWQPFGLPVMVTSCDPAAELGLAEDGLIEKLVQVGAAVPDWLTVNVFPATVALPDRKDVDVFCVHETVSESEPLPPVFETVSHDPLPEALQLPPWQPSGIPVMVTNCDAAAELGLAEAGLIEKLVQVGAAAPDWLTANVFPATVALPDRDDVEVFWFHETVSESEPPPMVFETVSHDPFPDALQLPPWQPLGFPVIVTNCDPAAELGLAEFGLIEKLVHVGFVSDTVIA